MYSVAIDHVSLSLRQRSEIWSGQCLPHHMWTMWGRQSCAKFHLSRNARKGGGRVVFDVTTKAALGMVDADIGATHVNSCLISKNIPAVHENTLKCREWEVGEH